MGAPVISDEEYKEKKARLVNKKFELQAKGSRDGEWLERYRNLLTLAHQASCIGSLSYESRENLSEFTRVIIYAISHYIKNILDLEKHFLTKISISGQINDFLSDFVRSFLE